jgi:hypothetical protein
MEMEPNEDFLTALQKAPPTAFSEALYARLAQLPNEPRNPSAWDWLLRSALPSFGLSVVLMAFVAALFPPVRIGLAQFIARATPISSNPAQSAHEDNVVVLTWQQARTSLPVTLTRIPALAPNGFVMSGTLLVYKMLTGTGETRADYFWQSDSGENLMLAVQAEATVQPITQTALAQPVRINDHDAILSDLVHRKDWVSLTWQDGTAHYSLLAPRRILSTTLIKMAESTNSTD